MNEVWKPIEGYEDYLVSNLGRVTTTHYRGSAGKNAILKPMITGWKTKTGKNRYLCVWLYKNGKPKTFLVHVLVARAFIPNPENLPEVNHIDEDKSNNAVTNLEWCTHKQNVNHGTGTRRRAKLQMRRVGLFDSDGNLVREFESRNAAAKFLKTDPTTISHMMAGSQKTIRGYVCKYLS